jgi:hypothetical protein
LLATDPLWCKILAVVVCAFDPGALMLTRRAPQLDDERQNAAAPRCGDLERMGDPWAALKYECNGLSCFK